MSYSFTARGASKVAALLDAEAKFKKVIEGQPAHALDEDAARKVREEAAALVGEPKADKDYYLSCNGSLSWEGTYPDSHVLTGASISAYAGHIAKE